MGILVTCTSSKSLKTQDVYFESRLSNLQEKISAFSALVFENMQKPSFDKMFYCERCDGFDFVIMDLEEEAEKLLDGKEKALRALRELEKLVRQIKNQINQHTPLLTSAEAFSEPAGAFFWGMAFSLLAQGVTYLKQRIDCYFSRRKTVEYLAKNKNQAIPEVDTPERIIEDCNFTKKGLLFKKKLTVEDYERQWASLLKKRDDTKIKYEAAKEATQKAYDKLIDHAHFPIHPRWKDIFALRKASNIESTLVNRLNKLNLKCAQTQIIVKRLHRQMMSGTPPTMNAITSLNGAAIKAWEGTTDNLPNGWGAIIDMQANGDFLA